MSTRTQISDSLEWSLLRDIRRHVLNGRLSKLEKTNGLVKGPGQKTWNGLRFLNIRLRSIFLGEGLEAVEEYDSSRDPELFSETQKVLRCLCCLLDSIANPTIIQEWQQLEEPYSKFEALLRYLDSTTEPFDMLTGLNTKLFDVSFPIDIETVSAQLIPCSDFIKLASFPEFDAPGHDDEMQPSSSPSYCEQDPFRDHLRQASEALFAELKTCRSSISHKLLRQLPPLDNNAESSFIATPSSIEFFLTTCSSSTVIEGAEVERERLGWRAWLPSAFDSVFGRNSDGTPTASQSVSERVNTIIDNWQEIKVELLEQVDVNKYRKPFSPFSLCQLVKSYWQRADGLHLLIQDNEVWVSRDIRPKQLYPGHEPAAILSKLLSEKFFQCRQLISPDEINKQRYLAARLTLALLTSFDSGQIKPWDANQIYFLTKPGELPLIDRAYISYTPESGAPRQVEAPNPDAAEPPLLYIDFAKLLLQVELNHKPEYLTLQLHVTSSWIDLQKIVDDEREFCEDMSRGLYLDAVESCLRFHMEYAAFPGSSRREDVAATVRRVLYQQVYHRIIKTLILPNRAQESRKRRQSSSHVSARKLKRGKGEMQVQAEFSGLPSSGPPAGLSQSTFGFGGSSTTHSPGSFGGHDLSPQQLMRTEHDRVNDGRPAVASCDLLVKKALSWFNKMDQIQLLLGKERHKKDYPPVKIAILDTGIDRDFAHFWKFTQEHYKDFVNVENRQGIDRTRHGTNGVQLLFKMLNNAEIHVVRCWKNEKADKNSPKLVEEAIRHAIGQKVDIINMSIGFTQIDEDEEGSDIRQAIKDAYSANILVFAAASNGGNSDGIAFPATLKDNVICIFATNGASTPSSNIFNPGPNKNSTVNFACLGEQVPLPWPGRSEEQHLSGTSISTYIASGLAAIIIDFSRQKACREAMQYDCEKAVSRGPSARLKTKEGMEAVFREMSKNHGQGGYDCISPWDVLKCVGPGSSVWKDEQKRKSICDSLIQIVYSY